MEVNRWHQSGSRKWSSCILLLSFLVIPNSQAADNQLLLAANSMIQEGKPLEAFDILSPYEFEYAGEKEFDYLLGLSLLDSGEPGKSVFAFQRILAQDPDFAGARMELARAYFDMSEYNLSRSEFTTLLSQSPPQNVQLIIDKYLSAIRNRTLRSRQGWSGYVQLGVGNDSNANNAPSVDEFLGFELSDQSKEISSSVVSTVGGLSYDLPVNYLRSYYFRSNLNHRSNNNASFTSSLSYDLSAGVKQTFKNSDNVNGSFQVYSSTVDGSSNNTGFNLNGQYNLNFSSTNQLGLFLRVGEVDYVKAFDVKDVSQTVFGTSWVHIFGSTLRPSLVATLIAGQDDQQLDTSPYGRTYSGARMTAAMALSHKFNIFTSMGVTSSTYDGQFFGLSGDREDDLSDISIGGSWRFSKNWTLKSLLNIVDNASNIDIYSYDKNEIMFIARSDFLP
jgi:tetratricopeptide (TPR) repeat protein